MATLQIAISEAPPEQALPHIEQDLQLTPDQLAQILSLRPCTIDSLKAGETSLRPHQQARYDALVSVFNHLHETFRHLTNPKQRAEAIHRWLSTANYDLDDKKPHEVLLDSDFGALHSALIARETGAFM